MEENTGNYNSAAISADGQVMSVDRILTAVLDLMACVELHRPEDSTKIYSFVLQGTRYVFDIDDDSDWANQPLIVALKKLVRVAKVVQS